MSREQRSNVAEDADDGAFLHGEEYTNEESMHYMHSAICLPNSCRPNLSPDSSSPWWYDLSYTSPMITHCHIPSQSPQRYPLRRIRSRSLGDIPSAVSPPSNLLLPPLFYDKRASKQGDDGDVNKRVSLKLLEESKVSYSTVEAESGTSLHVDEQQGQEEPENNVEKQKEKNPVWISILYGLINTSIVLPVLMSFGSIIYCDPVFAPYMPTLIKLTIVSGMVHQVCFSSLSTLPFAVGQVQDAGLIFLSQMARTMAQYCTRRGHTDDEMLATVTVGLGIATALLGCGLILIGKARLAQYVQALPTPVVGGYLAFIGWFCGMSGFRLMCGGTEDTNLTTLAVTQWMFWLPGVCGGLLIYVLVRSLRHMAVLPTCIVFILFSFYFCLWATNTSIAQATDQGWIPHSDSDPPLWYHTWDFVRWNKVVWSALPPQALTLVSMIFVVAISSSLDVAAIELELKNQPLDYNHELKMVGTSNLISGLAAGYTGSYIFSQSIFSLRAGITSRLAGFVIAACELIVFVLPFSVLSFVPNFFFGSLLVMICIDLMYEWLWDVRSKLTVAAYVICLCTFGFIQVLGVEYGILAGACLYFLAWRLGFNMGDHNRNEQEIQISA